MRTPPRILYHLTPAYNAASINRLGVHPDFATGVIWRVYFVQRAAINWAADHISKKHGCTLEFVAVFMVRSDSRFRSLGRGLWCVDAIIPVLSYKLYVDYLREAEAKS